MKALLLILSIFLITACDNSVFGTKGQASVAGLAWDGAPVLGDVDASAGGAYALSLAGTNLTAGASIVNLEIIDGSSGASLFAGDFLAGDDLSSATPTNVSGSNNFATDIQPYFDAGSVLDDASAVTFRKADWATNNGQFQSLFDPANPAVLDTSGNVAIPLTFSLTAGGATSNITLPINYKHSWDNSSTDHPSAVFPATFADVWVVGGIVSASSPAVIVNPPAASCGSGTNLYTLSAGGSPVTTPTERKVGGVWEPLTIPAQTTYTNAVLTAMGSVGGVTGGTAHGVQCVDRLSAFIITSSFADSYTEGVRLSDGGSETTVS